MLKCVKGALLVASAVAMWGCQSPTEPDEVDVTLSVSPNPTSADPSSGVTYRVSRDGLADEIREFDWKTSFTTSVTWNSKDKAAEITSVSIRVQQASGGIVVVPPGGEAERYDFNSSPSSNILPRGGTVTVGFNVWYDLPNLGKEAIVTVSFGFKDEDNATYTDAVTVRVAP